MKSISYKVRELKAVEGFTLIEMLVVLGIIALLATLVGPQVIRYLSKAKTDTAEAQIKNLESAIELHFLDTGHYPAANPGLASLLSAPPNLTGWNGPYLRNREALTDPWGRSYVYVVPGDHGEYDLYSYGLDGEQGGEGENRDIANW
jgi:general secretion pathway protein G